MGLHVDIRPILSDSAPFPIHMKLTPPLLGWFSNEQTVGLCSSCAGNKSLPSSELSCEESSLDMAKIQRHSVSGTFVSPQTADASGGLLPLEEQNEEEFLVIFVKSKNQMELVQLLAVLYT